MCDIRKNPTGILKIDTGEVFPVTVKYITYDEKADVTVPGVYKVIATGSYVCYYDGESWSYEGEKFKFLRPPGNMVWSGMDENLTQFSND